MDKLSSIINVLDDVAAKVELQDKRIALAIDLISDKIEKKAYFNQTTWLPGRSPRNSPLQQSHHKRTAVYICSSCSERRVMSGKSKCPKCGHFMHRL